MLYFSYVQKAGRVDEGWRQEGDGFGEEGSTGNPNIVSRG